MTIAMGTRKAGRPTRLESKLPAKVMTALCLAAHGKSWEECAVEVGMTADALRKWQHHPDTQPFIERVVLENQSRAENLIAAAAPDCAEQLIKDALDQKNKPYNRIDACKEVLRMSSENVFNKEQRKDLKAIRELLDLKESGGAGLIDVTDITEKRNANSE